MVHRFLVMIPLHKFEIIDTYNTKKNTKYTVYRSIVQNRKNAPRALNMTEQELPPITLSLNYISGIDKIIYTDNVSSTLNDINQINKGNRLSMNKQTSNLYAMNAKYNKSSYSLYRQLSPRYDDESEQHTEVTQESPYSDYQSQSMYQDFETEERSADCTSEDPRYHNKFVDINSSKYIYKEVEDDEDSVNDIYRNQYHVTLLLNATDYLITPEILYYLCTLYVCSRIVDESSLQVRCKSQISEIFNDKQLNQTKNYIITVAPNVYSTSSPTSTEPEESVETMDMNNKLESNTKKDTLLKINVTMNSVSVISKVSEIIDNVTNTFTLSIEKGQFKFTKRTNLLPYVYREYQWLQKQINVDISNIQINDCNVNNKTMYSGMDCSEKNN